MSFEAGWRKYASGPWGHRSSFRGGVRNLSGGLPVGAVVYRSAGVQANPSLSGVTRDSTGAVLGGCTVDVFVTNTDVLVGTEISDASTGAFQVTAPVSGPFYLVAYKAGAPDVAGTSVNTLTAV